MNLSIVICTYNRYHQLANCLASLAAIKGHRDDVEIVIVDNTPEAERQTIALLPNARTVYSSPPGLARARNEGIRASTGDIVAFVDDDTLIEPGWIEACLRCFDRPDIGIIGGKVVPELNGAVLPHWFHDSLWFALSCLDWSPAGRYLEPGEWIVGANMAFRREVFDQFGMFATNLGRVGSGTLLSNEEIALIEKYGVERIWYCPEMLVRHVISVGRLSPQWFRRRVYWQAVSDEILGIAAPSFARHLPLLEDEMAKMYPGGWDVATFFREPASADDFRKQLRSLNLCLRFCASGELS